MTRDEGRGGWRPQEEAKIGDKVLIRTAGGREFMAHLGWYGCDENGDDCVSWAEDVEGTAPPCWSDGICWEMNEDGVASDPPVSFLPPAPETAEAGQ